MNERKQRLYLPGNHRSMSASPQQSCPRVEHPPELFRTRLSLRGPPQPRLVTGWRHRRRQAFFACAPDHKQVTDGHQQTTVTDTGRLAWTDGTKPPEINHAHHPEELLRGNTDPPDTQQD